ncbi:hypothetical protein ACUOA8_57535, partial [Escherichia sp. SS-MK2]
SSSPPESFCLNPHHSHWPVTRPRAERGAFPPGTEHYGRSLLGAPLIWFPAPAASRESGLILAGTHGDENSSVVTLSCALRTLTP